MVFTRTLLPRSTNLSKRHSLLRVLVCTSALLTSSFVTLPAYASAYDAPPAGAEVTPLYPQRHSKVVAREEALIRKKTMELEALRAAVAAEKRRLAEIQREAENRQEEITDAQGESAKREIASPFEVGTSGYAEKPAPKKPATLVVASAGNIATDAPLVIAAASAADATPASPQPIGQLPAGGVAPVPSAVVATPTINPTPVAAPVSSHATAVAPISSNSAIAPIPPMVAEPLAIIAAPASVTHSTASVAQSVPHVPGKDIIEPGVFVEPTPVTARAPNTLPGSISVPDSPAIAGTPTVFGQAPGATSLGTDTRSLLARLPTNIGAGAPPTSGKVNIKRISPDIAEVVGVDKQGENFSAAGISINVRGGVYDANRDLSRAYDALVANDASSAIGIYSDILASDPKNQDALFGLAATYHRAGAIDRAKPLYIRLLELNPEHREGLNNFLALVSAQAPEDALVELEKLGARNPGFSPIHAQIALLYQRLGAFDRAREKMLYAIELSPENLVYQYNLAVMLDKEGQAADAMALYQKLIAANGRGSPLPAPVEHIQKRLNFLTAQSVAGSPS
jgi:Flp pilus assembly protein TadD